MREWSEQHNDFVRHDYDITMEIFDALPRQVRDAINSSPHGWNLSQVIPQCRHLPPAAIAQLFSVLRPEVVREYYGPTHPQMKQPGKKI